MARRTKSRKKSRASWWLFGSLVFAIVVVAGLVAQPFAVDSAGNTIKDGSFISVPTYGYLKCELSDSINSYPASGFQKFSTLTLTCQQFGSLLQECDVTLKMPSKDDLGGKYSGLLYSVCTTGSTCKLTDITPIYATYLWVDQDNNVDREIQVHIGPGQFLRAEYQESTSILGSVSPVNKGRYRVAFKPYQVFRYDVFSQSTGKAVPNTLDCTTNGDISELNLVIEAVNGAGKLAAQLKESTIVDENNLQARGATMTYISNFVGIVPQYQLFDDDSKYCYDKKVFAVEEVVTPGGTYKVANTGTNKELYTVECCNSGDVPSGYYCENFKKKPLSESSGAECSALKPCPIVGFQAVAGKRVAFQECVSGKCVTDFEDVECNFDEECPGGYCDADPNDPGKNACKYVDPVDYCGNNACEASFGETVDSCPKDCKDGGSGADYFWFFLVGGVLVAVIVILAIKASRRR